MGLGYVTSIVMTIHVYDSSWTVSSIFLSTSIRQLITVSVIFDQIGAV